jgi:redox-sensitive bicupin YhaK (pirin superfamily)
MSSPVLSRIVPRSHDLGGLTVRRALPHASQRSVGPFVFFDHMGPADFAPGEGIDVRPHPHIGIATVTFLFEGALTHRDSLGVLQDIEPGDVNWMTAGHGIVHSERSPAAPRASGHRLHGIQTWIALPQEHEETDPGFWHHPASELPRLVRDGVRLVLIAGTSFGLRAPTRTYSPMFYLAAEFDPEARLVLPVEHAERAVYVAEGELRIDGEPEPLRAGEMAVLAEGGEVGLQATADTRAMLCGGAPLDGSRFIWWNFVSSRKERIEQARRDWAEGRFAQVPGETGFIPLPE